MNKSDVDINRLLASAASSGTAYLAAMWVDNKVSSHNFNDLKLVGQVFTTKQPFWIIQAIVAHYGFSVVVTMLYATWAYRRLPGPGWLKGLLFLQLENAALYPAAAIMDKFHAGMREGQLPPLLNWKSFWGQVLRHVAFGLTLGVLYKPKH